MSYQPNISAIGPEEESATCPVTWPQFITYHPVVARPATSPAARGIATVGSRQEARSAPAPGRQA